MTTSQATEADASPTSARTRSLNLFPTVVMGFLPEIRTTVVAAMRTEIQERQGATPSLGRSNARGWHSATDFFRWSEATRCLEESLHGILLDHVLPHCRHPIQRQDYKLQGWANVIVSGAYNRPHTHPGALVSGVYYVDAGETAPETGGLLEFFDPRGATEMYSSKNTMLSEGHIESLMPMSGEVLVFPSWLRHWVTPYSGAATRISVAFNVVPQGTSL